MINFDLAQTLLARGRLLLLALPIVGLLAAGDAEQREEDRFDYTAPRDLGAAPFHLSEIEE